MRRLILWLRIVLLCVFVTFFCASFVGVYADDQGGGSDTSGTDASCKSAAYIYLCGGSDGDGSEGGGASWRIFKVDNEAEDKAYGLDSNTTFTGNILQTSYKNEAVRQCSDEGWFASYGWDGMYKSKSGYPNFSFQIGPTNRNPGNLIADSAEYNTYNNKSLDYLDRNNFPNNTRISAATALALYNRMHSTKVTSIPTDIGYFCVSPRYHLYGGVRNSSGGAISGYNDYQWTEEVVSGGTASISALSIPGYTFLYWWSGAGTSDSDYLGTDTTYTTPAMTSDRYVYAVYGPDKTLSGIAVVNNSSCTVMTGFHPDSATVHYGSPASIRAKEIRNLDFKGWRTNKCSGSYSGGIEYSVSSLTDDTRVYAVYEPKPLPCGGTCGSTIDIKQSKTDGSGWTRDVLYMKPGSTVYLKGSFNPQYQDKHDIVPQKLALSGSDYETNSSNMTIERYLNYKMRWKIPQSRGWNNAFSIIYDNELSSIDLLCITGYSNIIENNKDKNGENKYENGAYFGTYDYKTVLGSQAIAESKLNFCPQSKTTPNQIRFSYDAFYNLQAEISTEAIDASVTTYTPYNFKNTTEITTEQGIVYAGETKTIKYTFNVGDKENKLVGATYHTMVPGAKSRLRVIHKDTNGNVIRDEYTAEKTLGNLYNSKDDEISINIMDLPAGSQVCVRSYIYPSDNGSNDNISEDNFGGETHSDNDVCFTVAKKPSFQVWGGGLYSAHNIKLETAKKNNLFTLNNYNIATAGGTYVFSSFTELSFTSSGNVSGLASGAATGYSSNSNGTLGANPGGSTKPSYCRRIPLTIPNSNCSGSTITTNSIFNNIDTSNTSDKSALVDRFIGNDAEGAFKNYIVEDPINCSGSKCEIGGISDFAGETDSDDGIFKYTKFINAEGKTITITGDITYKDGPYNNLESIPKIIIYAENINILCSVKRIDAVLIAGKNNNENGKINTCVDRNGNTPDLNDANRSKRLKINGSIVANVIYFNRTYGASTGNNSIVPAEIVNYDSSLYLWADNQSSSKNTGRLTTTYIHDLAPRY